MNAEAAHLYNETHDAQRRSVFSGKQGMRMKALWGALTVGVVLLSQPVAAAPWDPWPRLQAEDQRAPQRHAPGQREMKREQRMAPERDERRRDRLTEDERRELRRDVDRANHEIYRRRTER